MVPIGYMGTNDISTSTAGQMTLRLYILKDYNMIILRPAFILNGY
jgi:hypothetical protein